MNAPITLSRFESNQPEAVTLVTAARPLPGCQFPLHPYVRGCAYGRFPEMPSSPLGWIYVCKSYGCGLLAVVKTTSVKEGRVSAVYTAQWKKSVHESLTR